jgi:hypothetical protein
VEDIGTAVGIHTYVGQGYEGVVSGKRLAISRDLHLYLMVVLSGRVSRAPHECAWRPPANEMLNGAMAMHPILLGGVRLRRILRILSDSCF